MIMIIPDRLERNFPNNCILLCNAIVVQNTDFSHLQPPVYYN